MTQATVNGETRELPPSATVDTVVRTLTERPAGVAVAVNGEVVPKHAWAATPVVNGDVVEVLTASQGG